MENVNRDELNANNIWLYSICTCLHMSLTIKPKAQHVDRLKQIRTNATTWRWSVNFDQFWSCPARVSAERRALANPRNSLPLAAVMHLDKTPAGQADLSDAAVILWHQMSAAITPRGFVHHSLLLTAELQLRSFLDHNSCDLVDPF